MHEMSPKAESRSIKLTDLPFDCLALIHEYLSPLGPRGEAEPTLPVWARLYSQAARDPPKPAWGHPHRMVAVPDKWSFYSSCKSVRSAVLGAAKYAVLLPRPIRGGDLDIAAAADAVRNVLSLATHVTQVDLTEFDVGTDAELETLVSALGTLPALRHVRLDCRARGLTARALHCLRHVPALECVEIRWCTDITPDMVQALSALPRLRDVDLVWTSDTATDEGFTLLRCIPRLRSVEIFMPPYVSQGSILRLRDLDIPRGVLLEFMLRRRGSLDVDFAWSDGALDALRQMRGLQGLDVAFLENAVRAVPAIGEMTQLTRLCLPRLWEPTWLITNATAVNDAILSASSTVVSLTRLRALDVTAPHLSYAFQHLQNLSALKDITLAVSQLEEEASSATPILTIEPGRPLPHITVIVNADHPDHRISAGHLRQLERVDRALGPELVLGTDADAPTASTTSVPRPVAAGPNLHLLQELSLQMVRARDARAVCDTLAHLQDLTVLAMLFDEPVRRGEDLGPLGLLPRLCELTIRDVDGWVDIFDHPQSAHPFLPRLTNLEMGGAIGNAQVLSRLTKTTVLDSLAVLRVSTLDVNLSHLRALSSLPQLTQLHLTTSHEVAPAAATDPAESQSDGALRDEQPGSPSRTFPHLMDISVFCGTAADLGTILRAITGPCFTPSLRSLELSVNPWWLGFNTLEQFPVSELSALSHLSSLEDLTLSDINVLPVRATEASTHSTHSGEFLCEALAGLPNLKGLHLFAPVLCMPSFRGVAALSGLRQLAVGRGNGLSAGMGLMEETSVPGSQVFSPPVWEEIASLQFLEHLELPGHWIENLAVLARLRNLRLLACTSPPSLATLQSVNLISAQVVLRYQD